MPEMRGGISDSVVARAEIDPSRAMEHIPASVSWSVPAYCVTDRRVDPARSASNLSHS